MRLCAHYSLSYLRVLRASHQLVPVGTRVTCHTSWSRSFHTLLVQTTACLSLSHRPRRLLPHAIQVSGSPCHWPKGVEQSLRPGAHLTTQQHA